MAGVVVNDLTIEPQTTPQRDTAAPPEKGGSARPGPELEREIEKLGRCRRERELRHWAH
jgi:hypothetical protein